MKYTFESIHISGKKFVLQLTKRIIASDSNEKD